MKTKTIKRIIGFIIFLVLGLLIYLIGTKAIQRNEISKKLNSIPHFRLFTLKDSLFTKSNLPSNRKIVFVYFNTECEHCSGEATQIKSNIDKFQHVQFYFVSFEKTDLIKSFASNHDLTTEKNVIFLRDKKHLFSEEFGANSIPYILIYDENRKLIKKHKGVLETEQLKNLLLS